MPNHFARQQCIRMRVGSGFALLSDCSPEYEFIALCLCVTERPLYLERRAFIS